jgi:hypothetical protein
VSLVAWWRHNGSVDVDAEYPLELEKRAAQLEELERIRSRARPGEVHESRVTDYVLIALTSGIIGNVGYDLVKGALLRWRRPRVRLPEQARDIRDALLLAFLGTQVRCVQLELPAPALQDLEALACERLPGRWRVELRRVDRRGYLLGGGDWPEGVALGATVIVPDGPLRERDLQVTVVAKGDIDAARKAEYQRIEALIKRLYPSDLPRREGEEL